MKSPRFCEACGRQLPEHALEGLCPRCLLDLGAAEWGIGGAGQRLKAERQSPDGEVQSPKSKVQPPNSLEAKPAADDQDQTSEAGGQRPLVSDQKAEGGAQGAGASNVNPVGSPRRDDRVAGRADGGFGETALPVRGQRFGNYVLLEKLGEGGMGAVYKARQTNLDRVVAVKLLLFGQFSRSDVVQRFRTEATAAASLQHPNIVAIHDVGEYEGQLYYSMDFIAGRTLAEMVRDQPLSARRAATCLKTIAEAVQYAHQCGILHRDLKPSNILIDESDQPRITDFGLAKRLCQTTDHGPRTRDLTLTGQVLGSPNFMSPEQAEGARAIGPASDIYSLGALLYHLLTRQPPFQADSLTTLLRQVIETEPVAPRLLNPSIPRDLETICLKCLEKEPPRRYSTAQELAEDLGRFLDDKPIQARPVSAAGKTWKWCRRNPVRAGLIAALVGALALGAAGVLWQWRRAELARQDAVEKLWQSYLAQAQASRWSARAGRRFAGLEALRQAASIRPTLELRNEAIACLALPDARVHRTLSLGGHTRIAGFAFDPAFERYACGHGDASIRVCRVSDDSELLKLPAEDSIEVNGHIFSPGGNYLAQRLLGKEKVTFRLWNTSRGHLVLSVAFPVRNMAFTPGEDQIALVEPGGRIHLHSLPAGTEVGLLTVSPEVNHVTFDPGGKRLAVSRNQSPSVVILDLKSKAMCAALTNAGGVGLMAWSPDGRLLACPSTDQRLYLWDVASGERKALEGHSGVVTAAVFNRAGDMLASCSWDGMTWFWDPNLGQPLVSLPGGWIANGFDPSDRRLGFGVGAAEFGIWEVEPARECRRLGRTAAICSGEFTPDGCVLATASSDGIRLWQVKANRLLTHLTVNATHAAIWHPNGRDLIGSGWSGIELWPIEFDNQASEVRAAPVRKLTDLCRGPAALASDGRFLAVAGAADADVLVIDLNQPNQPRRLLGHPLANSVSISPNGKWFATGTWHGTGVKVWSTETWQPVRELPVKGSARCIFSPDGRWLLTGAPEEYCLWEVSTWQPLLRLPRDRAGDMHGGMAISADARMAAVLLGRNSEVKLISIPDGGELASLDTGEPLCFSRDGGQLATTTADHRGLLVWDLRLIRDQLRNLKLDWD